jgi:hypothetical protein
MNYFQISVQWRQLQMVYFAADTFSSGGLSWTTKRFISANALFV